MSVSVYAIVYYYDQAMVVSRFTQVEFHLQVLGSSHIALLTSLIVEMTSIFSSSSAAAVAHTRVLKVTFPFAAAVIVLSL